MFLMYSDTRIKTNYKIMQMYNVCNDYSCLQLVSSSARCILAILKWRLNHADVFCIVIYDVVILKNNFNYDFKKINLKNIY